MRLGKLAQAQAGWQEYALPRAGQACMPRLFSTSLVEASPWELSTHIDRYHRWNVSAIALSNVAGPGQKLSRFWGDLQLSNMHKQSTSDYCGPRPANRAPHAQRLRDLMHGVVSRPPVYVLDDFGPVSSNVCRCYLPLPQDFIPGSKVKRSTVQQLDAQASLKTKRQGLVFRIFEGADAKKKFPQQASCYVAFSNVDS